MFILRGQDWRIVWLIAFVAVLIVAVKRFWRWRLRRWAESEGYRVDKHYAAHGFEWPGGGWPNNYNTIFRVEVSNSAGRQRTGWLKFGSPFLGAPLKDEIWF